jgi:hypothetical protein
MFILPFSVLWLSWRQIITSKMTPVSYASHPELWYEKYFVLSFMERWISNLTAPGVREQKFEVAEVHTLAGGDNSISLPS